MLNIDITTIKNEKDQRKIDELINSETQRKISAVPCVKHYNVMTACFISGEFVCVSEYDLPEYLINNNQKRLE